MTAALAYSALGPLPETGRFLLAMAIIMAATHIAGGLARRGGHPHVIGEIAAGILLGPGILGAFAPGPWHAVFAPGVLSALNMASQVGLVAFMFLLGSEIRFDRLRGMATATTGVAIATLAVPFLATIPLGLALYHSHGSGTTRDGFVLFFSLALAITALPVLARILTDMGLLATPVATMALTAAVAGDVAAWVMLAIVLAFTGSASTVSAFTVLAIVCAFTLLMVTAVRRGMALLVRRCEAGRLPETVLVPVALAGCLLCAVTTQEAGVQAVFGAFLFGAILPRGNRVVGRLAERIRPVVVAVLLPLFFAYVGLHMSFGTLGQSAAGWLTGLAVLILAVGTKLAGVSVTARACGVPAPAALQLGALMNCRGLTELVVATIGLSLHIIDPYLFTVLVMVALTTTALTIPLVRLGRRWEARRTAAGRGPGRLAAAEVMPSMEALDTSQLRTVLSKFATGVAVITTAGPGGQPVGMTVNSFSSVSLDPPLVLCCVSRSSGLHPVFTEAVSFAVNVLSGNQQGVSWRFARPGFDRFGPIRPDEGSSGVPLLPDTLARLECTTERVVPAGDHDILIGRVCAMDLASAASPEPLIFYGGRYRSLDHHGGDFWSALS